MVIYAHPPFRGNSLWDQLIFTILNDRPSSLFWHYLNGAHPLAMRHGIDYTEVQKLENFFLDNLPYRIIQPKLWFPTRCARWVYRDVMSVEGTTDSLKVLERVTQNRPMLL
jgi:hypothetical protein